MPYIAAAIELSEAVKSILIKISKSKTLPFCQVQRANIVLLAAQGLNNMQISKQVGLGQDSVSKWRHRFLNKTPLFQEIEEHNLPILEKEIHIFLTDLQRAGHPATFTDEQIIKILKIACCNPSDYGYESSHWSLNQLVAVVQKEGIAETISAKTISRFLKYGENPPSSRPILASFARENGFTGDIC